MVRFLSLAFSRLLQIYFSLHYVIFLPSIFGLLFLYFKLHFGARQVTLVDVHWNIAVSKDKVASLWCILNPANSKDEYVCSLCIVCE